MDAPEREYEGFTLNHTPISLPIASAGTTVIKVYFDRNTHNVNYVDNGANAPIASETHRYGENFIPQVPTRTGYGFAGWFVDEELTVPFDGYMILNHSYQGNHRSILFEAFYSFHFPSSTLHSLY